MISGTAIHTHNNAIFTQHQYESKYQNLVSCTLHRKWCSKGLPDASEYSDLGKKKYMNCYSLTESNGA